MTDCACAFLGMFLLLSVVRVAGWMTWGCRDFAFISMYVSVIGCSCLSDHRMPLPLLLLLLLAAVVESLCGQSACIAVAAYSCAALACGMHCISLTSASTLAL